MKIKKLKMVTQYYLPDIKAYLKYVEREGIETRDINFIIQEHPIHGQILRMIITDGKKQVSAEIKPE